MNKIKRILKMIQTRKMAINVFIAINLGKRSSFAKEKQASGFIQKDIICVLRMVKDATNAL